ncbi:Transposon TX1 uncharacterized 149 kDa protein [Linum perenne]
MVLAFFSLLFMLALELRPGFCFGMYLRGCLLISWSPGRSLVTSMPFCQLRTKWGVLLLNTDVPNPLLIPLTSVDFLIFPFQAQSLLGGAIVPSRELIELWLMMYIWIRRMPESSIIHLHKVKSDHRPIVLCPIFQVVSSNVKPFRFLSAWLSHPSFDRFVKNKWDAGADLPSALASLSLDLKKWNKHTFGDVFRRKKRLQDLLVKAEERVASNPSPHNIQEESRVRSKLELTLWQEEAIWIQKSRSNWAVDGDRNTRFFHLAALKRRAINRIKRLKDGNGVWVEDNEVLLSMAISFFGDIYTVDTGPRSSLIGFSGHVPTAELSSLARPLAFAEINCAVRSMGGLKAPGKDGFGPIFFQHCWQVVGTSFSDFISRCFGSPSLIPAINDTLITLIPKKQNPDSFSDFRPISLCNVAYKTLSKCIANRIKGLMPDLTHPSQTSFVPGRHITDNIMLVQEVVHSLHTKKGKKYGMVIKIDLAKAYDKIDWNFVRDTLTIIGFPSHLVEVIMRLLEWARRVISSVMMKLPGDSKLMADSVSSRPTCLSRSWI